MRNHARWTPSKFVYRRGALTASLDRRQVGVASRLIATLVARHYDAHLRSVARGRLLDLGCGHVPLYHAYGKRVREVICVDWGNTLHPSIHLDVECDLTQNLPFADATFDTIVLSDVLEHIPNPEDLCREMARILAPGGRILLNVPFYYWIHEEPHDYHRYTEFALRRLITRAGLSALVLEPIGGFPEVLADLVAKGVHDFGPTGRLTARVVQAAVLRLIRTNAGARVSRSSARRFPLGYFLVAGKGEVKDQPSTSAARS